MAAGEQPVPQISSRDHSDVWRERKVSKTHVFCRVECRIDPSCDDA